MTTCPEHGLSLPCQAHAADHLAGEHVPGSHPTTCPRCAAPTITHAQLDGRTLAAGDKTLDPEETA